MRIAILLCAGFALLLIPAAVHAQIPPGFEVIRLTDDPDLDGPPAINNLGHVVWSKRINQGFDTEEIFLWDGAAVRRITNDNVRDAFPDINDNGTIVWSRRVGPGRTFEIAKLQNGQVTILTDNDLNDSGPHANNLGHVVWNQFTNQGCTEADIFFHDGELVRQITNDGFSNQGPGINDLDEIAWTRYDFCVNPWRGAIMLYSQDATTQLSDGLGQDQSVTINNNQQVSWGWGPPDQDGIAFWENGATRDITSWGAHPDLNSQSDIVFQRWHEDISATKQWIYSNGEFVRITADDIPELVASINDCAEVAWNRGPFPDTDVFLMRMIPGDTNHDGTIELTDFEVFNRCLTGPTAPGLQCGGRSSDVDADGDVDMRDYVLFSASTDDYVQYETLVGCMTGPRRLAGRCNCLAGDFDRDGDVDLRDFAGLQTALSSNP